MLSTEVPVVLLDVDGVLNASRSGWGGPPTSRTVCVDGVGYRMRWAPQLAARLTALHRSGRAEIRWATSWVGNTGTLERVMALPHWPDAFASSLPVTMAKRDAALAVAETGRRLVWVDDEAFPPGWIPRGMLEDAGHLLIAPNPRRGLREADMIAIETFCGMTT